MYLKVGTTFRYIYTHRISQNHAIILYTGKSLKSYSMHSLKLDKKANLIRQQTTDIVGAHVFF